MLLCRMTSNSLGVLIYVLVQYQLTADLSYTEVTHLLHCNAGHSAHL